MQFAAWYLTKQRSGLLTHRGSRLSQIKNPHRGAVTHCTFEHQVCSPVGAVDFLKIKNPHMGAVTHCTFEDQVCSPIGAVDFLKIKDPHRGAVTHCTYI